MRIIKAIPYILIAIMILGFLSLNTPQVQTWAKVSIEEHLTKALEKEVSIGDLHFAFPFNIQLTNVCVNCPKPVKIENVEIQSSPLQFILKDYRADFTALGLSYNAVRYPDFSLKGKATLFANPETKLLSLSFNSSATVHDIPLSLKAILDLNVDGSLAFNEALISVYNKSICIQAKGSFVNETLTCEVSSKDLDLSVLNNHLSKEIFGRTDLKAKIQYSPTNQLIEFESFLQTATIEKVTFQDTLVSGYISDWLGSTKGKIKAIVNEASYNVNTIKRLCFETFREKTDQHWHFKIANLDAVDNGPSFYLTGFLLSESEVNSFILSEAKIKYQQHVLSIKDPLEIFASEKGIKINESLLSFDDGVFKASVELTKENVHAELKCENIPLSNFGKLFDLPELTGDFSGKLICTGHPKALSGTYSLDVNNIEIEESAFKNPPKLKASMQGTFSNDLFDLHGGIYGKDTKLASIDAKIPIVLTEFRIEPIKPLQGRLTTGGDITPILNQFLSLQAHASGKFDLTLILFGNFQKPMWRGTGKLYEGSYESLNSGAHFQNISAELELTERKLSLKEFQGVDKQGGQISGTGSLELDPKAKFPFDLSLKVLKGELVHLDSAVGTATGSITFKGNLDSGALAGDLTLDKLQVTISEQNKGEAPALDITYINTSSEETVPTEFKSPSKWPISLDINISATKNFFINAKDLTSEWKGEMKLNGTTNAPLTFGEFRIIQGEYFFNGRPFKLSQGTINFAGEPEKKTNLFVVASMDIEEVIADVVLKGSIKAPTISFRSNPPLPQREILSLILFGKGISEISPFQGTELSKSITKLKSSGNEGTDFLGKLKSTLGIDRVQFNQDGQPGNTTDVSVQVGKYVTKGVYVGITRSIVSESNRVGIEANVMKNVKVQAEIGDDAEGQLNLKWKHDY